MVRWLHRVAHSKSTEGWEEGNYLSLYFKRLLKRTSLDRSLFRSLPGQGILGLLNYYPKQFKSVGRVPTLIAYRESKSYTVKQLCTGRGNKHKSTQRYLRKLSTAITHICCIHALFLDRKFIRKFYGRADTHSIVLVLERWCLLA